MDNERDGRTDFDFFVGKWTVKHRKLKELLKGSDQWEEFESTVEDRQIMGGIGNLEEMIFERDSGRLYGTSLSIYNPKTGLWSQYWVDSAYATLSDPMVGKFTDGVGIFYAADTLDDHPVQARSRWFDITPTSCRWDQALSGDDGKTWEVNWVMEFQRV